MENLEHIENKLATICDEMRECTIDSFASKLVAEYEETGRIDEYINLIADRIKAALDDPGTVFAILRDFHDNHYSVFPRDELTERLCHAFYDQFVVKPNTEGV